MLKHHDYHNACDKCMKITTYFCSEDGIICEDCFNKKPKSLRDQLLEHAENLKEFTKQSEELIKKIKKQYKID